MTHESRLPQSPAQESEREFELLHDLPDPHGLDAIFRPRSVAIVGASDRPSSIGREILNNLVEGGFQGRIHPVNPKHTVLRGIACYAAVSEIPGRVDLAILVVPADQVLQVAEDCGAKGVRGLVVITAGFREIGGEGRVREESLREIVRRHGMRMIGPNCMGVFNTEEDIQLNASFARTRPLPGKVAMLTQSGALGEVLLEHARSLRVGFSMFASVGNKTDLSGNDLLLYWEDDPRTEILLLYLESFGNPRRFTQIARRITRRKPIVAVKAGRTVHGARAAVSHTGALAGGEVGTEALFEQCGVLRVNSVPEMFDLTLALSCQPLPRGDRIAVVTNAGGPGILATDALVNLGFRLTEFEAGTLADLRASLPMEASTGNPVDLLASADPGRYDRALRAVLRDPGVDAVLVIFVPPIMIDAPGVARVIHAASSAFPETPLLGCFMGQVRSFPELEREYGRRVPLYAYPEEACRALAAMARYQRLSTRPDGRRIEVSVDRARGQEIMRRARVGIGQVSLSLSESFALIEAYGIPVADWSAGRAEEIPELASALGYPVALKGDVASSIHKTEHGLIASDLTTPVALKVALKSIDLRMRPFVHQGDDRSHGSSERIEDRPEERAGARTEDQMEPRTEQRTEDRTEPRTGEREEARSDAPRFIVQKMMKARREVLIGVVQDPVFGPLLGFGLGGIFAETLHDMIFRITPLTDRDAAEMLDGIRGRDWLAGVRGEPPVDRAALIQILARVSKLVEDFPEIEELDLNPILAQPAGRPTCVVDARVILRRSHR